MIGADIALPGLAQASPEVQGNTYPITELTALDRCIVLELFAGADPDAGDVFCSDFQARVYACAAAMLPIGDDLDEDELTELEEARETLRDRLQGTKGTFVDELYPHVAELCGLGVTLGKLASPASSSAESSPESSDE